MTPAMLAACGGHVQALDHLVGFGAKLDEQNARGNTCMHLAVLHTQSEVIKCLLRHNASYNLRNNKNQLPTDLISSQREHSMHAEWEHTLSTSELAESPLKLGSYSVPTQRIGSSELRMLFPNVADEDNIPLPHTLFSVGALVLSRTAGVLTRRLLRLHNAPNAAAFGMLKRVETIGRGGFANVIKVEMPSMKGPRWFALKLERKEHANVAACEVLALRRVSHPFIVRLLSTYQTPRFFLFLLEFCPTDLNRRLFEDVEREDRCLGLPVSRVGKYMGQVLLALVHLHDAADHIHRDVKPENILISDQDSAKLTDFGLVKAANSAEIMMMSGTLGFIAPELTARPSFRRDNSSPDQHGEAFKQDAYSFGITLQLVLLGEDAARKTCIPGKGPVLLPLHMGEDEIGDVLNQLNSVGRLTDSAYSLMKLLLPHKPEYRSALKHVTGHCFFQEALGCEDLNECLMPSFKTLPKRRFSSCSRLC